MNPTTGKDGYKGGHVFQYPTETSLVMANMTARGSRVPGIKKVYFILLQYYIKEYLIRNWNENFFHKPWEEVRGEYVRMVKGYLGPGHDSTRHLKALHDLGYLPLSIWALPEGSAVPLRVPMFVVHNTCPDVLPDHLFYWLTNDIETTASNTIWLPCTSATTAVMYRQLLDTWADKTNPEMKDFVPWQIHDFSMRGHGSVESSITSAFGHVMAATGTDTWPVLEFAEKYYGARCDTELVGGSIPATEHAVCCVGAAVLARKAPKTLSPGDFGYNYLVRGAVGLGTIDLDEALALRYGELQMFKRLITEVYPKGPVAIVSDTWNLWDVVNPQWGILVELKDVILQREGKLVIRPDSGDPVKICTGYRSVTTSTLNDTMIQEFRDLVLGGIEVLSYNGQYYDLETLIEEGTGIEPSSLTDVEVRGLVGCLHDIFGSTITSTGYNQLDSHIGAIYGDSITLERATQICERLAIKGFASTNMVYGVGSFTYNGMICPGAVVTRDTHGFAVKATYCEILEDGVTVGIDIYKDPATDDGLKKSARGITAVYEVDGEFVLKDKATWEEFRNCALLNVFENSNLLKEYTFTEVKDRVLSTL